MTDTLHRPIADPGPLGLAAFAMTTFVLSVFNSGIVDKSATAVVFGLAIFYGGLGQLIAGAFEFVRNNTFGAVAFVSYGGFWLAFWYLNTKTDLSGAGSHASAGVAVFLLAWAIFTGYMLACVIHVNWALTSVFALLFVTFLLLFISEASGSVGIGHVAGFFGLATAVAAWYTSFAGVFNTTSKKMKLPIGARP